jgi:hypothetical protein
MIDTDLSQWSLSPLDLRENWPVLLNQFRQSGNRRFNPVAHFSPSFTSFNDVRIERLAWDYMGSRCAHLELQSRFGNVPPVSGFDYENDLYRFFNTAQDLYRQGLYIECEQILGDCLDLFDRICARLSQGGGVGYGKGMYMEVIEMARLFAPLVAEIDPSGMYSLLESLYKMTGHDDQTLRRMLFTITPAQQDEIRTVAFIDYQVRNSILARHILEILM